MTTTETTTSTAELDALASAARSAAPIMAATPASDRAAWLRAIADTLDAASDELVALADEETHLGAGRLSGEVARTTGQLRLFASALEEGSYAEAIIDHSVPDATPPRPDLRRMLRPVGPVAVFSASNFPFAFSVAGGDTASALAVGCPVIVKAHSGHARLSARTAELVAAALSEAGAPAGAFALVEGRSAGEALVQHPAIQAAGFTGSVSGGRALYDLAAARPDPIPFYGELGSANPVVITPAAVAARGAELASGLVGSFTLGVGQFCTKPGLVFVPAGAGFEQLVTDALSGVAGGPMLTERIATAYPETLREHVAAAPVTVLEGAIEQPSSADAAQPVLLATSARDARKHPDALYEECFGPTTLLIAYDDSEDLLDALRALPGSLTATIHAEDSDDVSAELQILSDRAGRILFAGWPTGVAVNWAQHHGGPWPATTSLHTSVGVTAARRFQRPIAYQDAPDRVLPPELRDDNPLGIPRRVDGALILP